MIPPGWRVPHGQQMVIGSRFSATPTWMKTKFKTKRDSLTIVVDGALAAIRDALCFANTHRLSSLCRVRSCSRWGCKNIDTVAGPQLARPFALLAPGATAEWIGTTSGQPIALDTPDKMSQGRLNAFFLGDHLSADLAYLEWPGMASSGSHLPPWGTSRCSAAVRESCRF